MRSKILRSWVMRRLARERETVEFRPIPGHEDEWAGASLEDRSRAWDWLGTYPLLIFISLYFMMIGLA